MGIKSCDEQAKKAATFSIKDLQLFFYALLKLVVEILDKTVKLNSVDYNLSGRNGLDKPPAESEVYFCRDIATLI